jgi:hypothetical protein
MLTGRPSDWSDERNRKLATALTILEEETCKSCGTPAWIGHSTNNEIVFDMKSSVCYGCAELERDREDMERNRGGRQRMKGETRYVNPRSVWGEEYRLPSRVHAYQNDMPD